MITDNGKNVIKRYLGGIFIADKLRKAQLIFSQ